SEGELNSIVHLCRQLCSNSAAIAFPVLVDKRLLDRSTARYHVPCWQRAIGHKSIVQVAPARGLEICARILRLPILANDFLAGKIGIFAKRANHFVLGLAIVERRDQRLDDGG